MTNLTPIQKTFLNSNVFLTGGTGFIGSLIIEKLLRATDVRHIFMLVRPKKNKTREDRLEKLFNQPEFIHLRSNGVNFNKKIILISGDLKLPGLGINGEDLERLINEVDIVIHCGATVNFVEPLNVAIRINIKATMDLLEIATKFQNLKCFCHMSTAFSNCNRLSEVIEEKFYESPLPWKDLFDSLKFLDKMERAGLNELTKKMLRDWPNTYTYTKQITEGLIQEYKDKFPICIVRPSIVTAAAKEPIAGFVNNFNTISGLLAGVGLGVLRVVYTVPNLTLNIIPVDYVVNCTLAAIWDTVCKSENDSKGKEIRIYNNTVNQDENKLTAKKLGDVVNTLKHYHSTNFMIWYPFCITTENSTVFEILSFLFHVVPVYLADFVLFCMGRERWIVKTYKKNYSLVESLKYFCTTNLHFDTTNSLRLWNQMTLEDQNLFTFEERLDFYSYFDNYIQGLKKYTLKDASSTETSIKKYKKFKALHGLITGILIMVLYYVVKFIVIRIFF